MATISVLRSQEREARCEDNGTSAYHHAVKGTASASSLQEMLATVLDGCCILGYGCSAVVLLAENGSSLEGRLFLPRRLSHQWPQLWQAAAGESGAIDWPLRCNDNLVVAAFRSHSPQVSSGIAGLLPPGTSPNHASLLERLLSINCTLVFPLLTAERCLGVLVLCDTSADADATFDLSTVAVFGSIAALCVERAHLQEELRERDRQVSLLLKATIDAQEEERERICLEIHDGVAQTLAPAFHYLQALDNRPELSGDLRTTLRKAASMVRTAIHEAREVIATLRPAALDALGLVSTLRFEIEELSVQTGRQIEFVADQTRLPKAIETALYRIVHEAITNVTKHASASWMALHLKQEGDYVRIEVRDNGVGFDLGDVDGQVIRRGFGLLSMRKRAELLGGELEVVSGCGSGTIVRVIVPLGRPKPEPLG